MRKFFRRLLRFLGIIKPKVVVGSRAILRINGKEVAMFRPSLPMEEINVLGHFEPVEGNANLESHDDIEKMVRGE